MRRVILMCVAAVLLTAGFAAAHTEWQVQDPDAAANGFSNWFWTDGVNDNWTQELPGEDPTDKTRWLSAGQPECILDEAAECFDIAVDRGGLPGDGGLTIVKGGVLTSDSIVSGWSAIGYSGAGRLNVERGGSIGLNARIICGRTGPERSQININGGTFTNTARLQLYEDPEPGIDITMNGGLLDLGNGGLDWRGTYSGAPLGSEVNINFGTIIVNGNDLGDNQRAIDEGGLVAFGGLGTVVMDYNVRNAGKTTITATGDPLERYPTYDEAVHTGTVNLSWVNLPSDPPGGDVSVDVWFGTDNTWVVEPNELLPGYPGYYVDWNKIVDANTPGGNVNITTVPVDAPVDGQEYIWRVDTYGTVAGDPDPVKGILMVFTAYDDLAIQSVVMEGVSMVTWAGQSIPLEATITDDGGSTVMVVWSAVDNSNPGVSLTEPNAIFTNEQLVNNGDGTFTATADVTIDYHAAQFTVAATASDASSELSASQQHDCAESACQATRVLGYGAAHPADIVADCVIDILDLAAFAADWVADYAPTGPTEIQ